jgi:hypothetical protein
MGSWRWGIEDGYKTLKQKEKEKLPKLVPLKFCCPPYINNEPLVVQWKAESSEGGLPFPSEVVGKVPDEICKSVRCYLKYTHLNTLHVKNIQLD